MGTVHLDVDRERSEVWSRLADADRYPEWLIGGQHSVVPSEWPGVGSSFEHRIGFGPLRIPGTTTSRRTDPPEVFEIDAGLGVLGEAHITFRLDSPAPGRTRITMTERPSGGILGLVDRFARFAVDPLLDARNAASLRRFRRMLDPPAAN
jgi:hypothetical protein